MRERIIRWLTPKVPQFNKVERGVVAEAFRLSEYNRLAAELQAQVEEAWRMEKLAIGGVAALIAWLMANPLALDRARSLPFLFIVACGIRFGAAMWHVVFRLGVFLQEVERSFVGLRFAGDDDDHLGLEVKAEDMKKEVPRSWEVWFRGRSLVQAAAHLILWGTLLLFAGWFWIWGPANPIASTTGRYEVVAVAKNGVPSAQLERVLERESNAGRFLVTTYTSGADEFLIFEKR